MKAFDYCFFAIYVFAIILYFRQDDYLMAAVFALLLIVGLVGCIYEAIKERKP